MKKFIIPMLAVLIGVGLSAFTSVHKKDNKNLQDYFWYSLRPDGKINQLVYSDMDKDAVIDADACHDQTTVTCLIGSPSDELDNGDAAPAVNQPSRDNQITFTTAP